MLFCEIRGIKTLGLVVTVVVVGVEKPGAKENFSSPALSSPSFFFNTFAISLPSHLKNPSKGGNANEKKKVL